MPERPTGAPDKTLVSFDINTLFTNIPVPVALNFINSKCTEHMKQHMNSSNISNAIYQYSVSNNHPKANICHLKIKGQDSRQVAMEAREAIYIGTNISALNCKM